jgi:hypothetical protein
MTVDEDSGMKGRAVDELRRMGDVVAARESSRGDSVSAVLAVTGARRAAIAARCVSD